MRTPSTRCCLLGCLFRGLDPRVQTVFLTVFPLFVCPVHVLRCMQEFDLEAEEYVPLPKGEVHKKKEVSACLPQTSCWRYCRAPFLSKGKGKGSAPLPPAALSSCLPLSIFEQRSLFNCLFFPTNDALPTTHTDRTRRDPPRPGRGER